MSGHNNMNSLIPQRHYRNSIAATATPPPSKVNATEGSSATEVTEAISGEMVLGKTALPDVKMVSKEEEHAEAANGKMGSREILTPRNLQNLKAENGETGPGTTAADTTASKKKKSPLSGDILSTSENIQDKVNAIDGLSTTKVLDTKVTNKTKLSDITKHNVDDKKGPEVVNSEIGASPTGALRAYLEGFAAADVGRTYVEQNPFGQGPIDEMNRDWKYYSRVLNSQKQYCTSQGLTIQM
ncbi:HAD-like domain-containing protein [Artemisia annua]|uniref:HAD-like domain-containing protein n=1 Tax=Artemisia annua TaxID=35608 RepID=A0A2U1P931_ARTAN|nr:HAD-like domain-containing protein [Artemisia annua]